MAKLSTRVRDLDRASAIALASARVARVAASIEMTNRTLPFPSSDRHALLRGIERSRDDRYKNTNASERINGLGTYRGGLSNRAMNAMSRLGRASQTGKAAHAIEVARRTTPGLIGKASRSRQIAEGLESKRPSQLHADVKANLLVASSVRAMTSLQTLHTREPANPPSDPKNGNVRHEITINASPTVVINGAASGSNVRHDVIEALRAHREELFDQLKRESARRERAQF